MSLKGIVVIVGIMLVALCGTSIYVILNVNTKITNESSAVISAKEGYKLVQNNNLEFYYEYKSTKKVVSQLNSSSGDLKLKLDDFIYNDIGNTKGYQYPGINVTVSDISILGELNLESWVKTVSTTDHNDFSNNSKLRYTSKSYIVLPDSKCIFFLNSVPFLGNGSLPVLLCSNDHYIYSVAQNYSSKDLGDFLEITVGVKVGNEYVTLTNKDKDLINDYFLANENI